MVFPSGRVPFESPSDSRELYEAERALRRSEARKSIILEAALDCIVMADEQGVITEWNLAATRTFGYPRTLAVGRKFVDLIIPPSLRAKHNEGFRRFRATGEGPIIGKRIETRALRADGSEFPVELTVVADTVEGQPIFAAYIRDITERHHAAELLRASESRFQRLADSGVIGIIVCDTEGNIEDANQAFLDMTGFSRGDITSGQVRWAEMTPPEWRPYDEIAVQALATSGVAPPWEKEYFRKDGTRLPVLVGVASLDPPRAIAFVLDLSSRKHAEDLAARAAATAVAESARREEAQEALRGIEEQLRQSQKMEAIGTLAGGIAHDFNNLLSVILGYGDMTLKGLRQADPMRADVEEMVRAGQRATELTRQLLAFSRQQVLTPQNVDLNETVLGMSRMLERIIGENIELSVRPTPNLGLVHVDPGQIEQVLVNLVVNGRDAMPQGGRLTIETANVELDERYAHEHLDVRAGPHVMLSVSDSGIGMDKPTVARVFDPFFTMKEIGKGTGLGLSTAFGIVKQSGGTIWVYSEIGQGTTFKVYLPLVEGAVRPTRSTTPPEDAPEGRGETVLLVEDDPQVRGVTSEILSRHGYRVLEAGSADDARLVCAEHLEPIQVLLTDVVMPYTTGTELARELAPLRPEMRVLFMSGYTSDTILHHGVGSTEAFLQKPIVPRTLLGKLRKVLRRPAGER